MISKVRSRIIIIAIAIPIIVALLLEFSLIWKVETDNDWIGFFASYTGAIIGVYGVFEVMRLDQRKREEERKDEFFLSNLPMYRRIASSLNVEKLYNLKEGLLTIRSEKNWEMVDSSTKNKLQEIEGNLYYSDELDGLSYTIRRYISNNLFDELKVTLNSSGDEFSGAFEYEDVPNETLDAMTNIITNNSDLESVYENKIELSVSKAKLLEELEKNNYTKGYGQRIDAIYIKLSKINESREWSEHISKWARTFKQVNELRDYINSRIDRLLNY